MLTFRNLIKEEDLDPLREILSSTHFFDQSPDEIDVAIELAQLAVSNGNNVENYDFIIAEYQNEIVGFICFSRVPCSLTSFEIYWLCVAPNRQGMGIGKQLINEAATIIIHHHGKKIILQTAGREQYLPTQKFYTATGFSIEARIKDYYAIGDDCLIFTKEL